MKVFVYGFREEERVYFEECAKRYGIAYAACSNRKRKNGGEKKKKKNA